MIVLHVLVQGMGSKMQFTSLANKNVACDSAGNICASTNVSIIWIALHEPNLQREAWQHHSVPNWGYFMIHSTLTSRMMFFLIETCWAPPQYDFSMKIALIFYYATNFNLLTDVIRMGVFISLITL